MATNPYLQHAQGVNTTSQSQSARSDQVRNNAGGFVFTVSPWDQLDRFLILGASTGTYYVGPKALIKENADLINKLLEEDGIRVIDAIVDVSINGRAYKQDPTLFALAMAASYGTKIPTDTKNPQWVAASQIRRYALSKLSDVCRTGTMLFSFIEYATAMRSFGDALVDAVNEWYLNRTPASLATQVVKYRQRGNWNHKRMLRLSHPKIGTLQRNETVDFVLPNKAKNYSAVRGVYDQNHPNAGIIRWLTKGEPIPDERLIVGFMEAQTAPLAQIPGIVREYQLPWEALPTETLNSAEVWEALVPHLGLTAILRNLGKMSAINAARPHAELTKMIIARLTAWDDYRRARVHPMQVLLAGNVYGAGRGVKGKLTWTPVGTITSALNDAFYHSFGALEATGKRRMLSLDVSGSMDGSVISDTHLTAREASTALALVAMNQDPESYINGFTGGFVPLNFTARTQLNDAMAITRRLPFERTDCAVPMVYALRHKLEIDSFEIYTDSETWAGRIHPFQALREYREKMGIDAKLIVNGMTATRFTIADPSDRGMLDVVGFDANAPKVVENFIRS